MKENFLRMLSGLKKDDLKYLLTIYGYYPEDTNDRSLGMFEQRIFGPAKKWASGLKHYDPSMNKENLHNLLLKTIVESNKFKTNDNLDDTADKIVYRIAKLEDLPIDPEMKTREIENQMFLHEAEEMYPIYLLALRSMLLMSQQNSSVNKRLQEKIIKSFLDKLLITKEQKILLDKQTKSDTTLKELEELVAIINKKKNINKKQIYVSILGFAWIIAISDDVITREEISFYKILYNIFRIKDGDAIKLKHKVEDQFEKVREEAVSALEQKGNKLGSKDLSDVATGISGSLTLLGLAEAAGFGLFLFATTALQSIGLLFGVTFSFATYTTLTWTLGLITGPVGWIGIPLIVAGGLILKNHLKNKDYLKTKNVILKLTYMRGDI